MTCGAKVRRVVLIHGFGCDARFWAPQIEAICAAGYEVAAPDLPYHGGPTAGVAKSLQGLAQWVADTQLGQAAVLVGHSLGGMIALQISHEAPTRVAGLALVDSFPSLEMNASYLPAMYPPSGYADIRRWIDETRAEILQRMTRETEAAIWPSVAAFDARPWLPELNCPVLGVYGGRSRYRANEAQRLRHELMLDRTENPASVTVIPQAGHFVNLEEPQAVNQTMLQWLETL